MREVLHRRPNDFNAFAADWFSNPKLKSHIDARIAKGNPPRDLGLDQNYGSICESAILIWEVVKVF